MPDLQDAADATLAQAAQEGDLAAYDELVRRHQKMITRCLYRFCPHRSDLEDLVQEAFIRAFRKLHLWDPKGQFENWLRKIAYNIGYDHFRKDSRNPVSIARPAVDVEWDSAEMASVDKAMDRSDAADAAHHALSQLDAEERMLLTLQYLEERSLAEIADVMNWSLAKTKVKSFRARKRLQKHLKRHE